MPNRKTSIRKTASAAALLVCPLVIHAVPVEAQEMAEDQAQSGEEAEVPMIPPPAPPALYIPPPAPPAPPAPVRVPPPAPPREYVSPAPPAPPPPLEIATYDADPTPAHFDLYVAMEEGVDDEVVMEMGLATMRRELARDPNIRVLEKQSPGLIDEIAESVRPMLISHTGYVRELYLPRMASLFATYLTPEEAEEAAAFYRSPLGKRMLGALSNNFTIDAMMSDLKDEGPISDDQINRDLNSTVAGALGDLSPEDMAEMQRTVLSSPALLKMNVMQSQIRSLRVQMENEPMTPETEQAMMTAMEAVFTRRFGM